MSALRDVENLGNLPVPMNIRNAPTKLMKDLGYGKNYDLPANATHQALQAGKYTNKSLLPEKLSGKTYYTNKNERQD
jgi:putative ATPase